MTRRPGGSTSRRASADRGEVVAPDLGDDGRPPCCRAAAARLRPPTARASAAKTVSAAATVTIATTRRVAGLRAASSRLTPTPTRPRATSPRPTSAAEGAVRWASTRPTTTASSPGAASADRPVQPARREQHHHGAGARDHERVADAEGPAGAPRQDPAQQRGDRLARDPGDGQRP